jgi:uncharacterized protein (TIGR01319 family)
VARTYSSTELCAETGAELDLVEWLTRIGILDQRRPGTYTPGDIFRVKMIASLLEAGFTRGQVESAVSAAGLNLEHVDRYVLRDPSERSSRTFAQFAAGLGPGVERQLPAVYQLFGLTPPDPESHLAEDEEALLREFMAAWSLASDGETPLRAARLIGEGTRTATVGWADLLYEQIAGPARERWLRRELDEYPREVADTVADLFDLLPRLAGWLIERYVEQTVTSGIADIFEEVLASRGLAPEPGPVDPPAVVFVDVSGFTGITEQRGDEAAVGIATALQQRAERVASERGGRVVKLLGDGAMLYFREAAAAARAALGAGARLLAVYCHRLSADETADLAQRGPDLVLLTGGTDGGDRHTVLHNAAALAVLPAAALGPVVVAGNKEATPEAVARLRRAGHDARAAANVLPELGTLRVEPAQEAIRRVFLERIVQSKGLDEARTCLGGVDGVVLPTPAAVLRAAVLLAEGPPAAAAAQPPPGPLGDLVVVDVGGATTDVHSIGDGGPSRPEVYRRGIPEPRAKRTVEGDLGLRVSALSLWEALGARWDDAAVPGLSPDEGESRLRSYVEQTAQVPSDPHGAALDGFLARGAVALALERHAGALEEVATPAGRFWVQRGKDLRGVRAVVGAGGIFRARADAVSLLEAGVSAAGRMDKTRLAGSQGNPVALGALVPSSPRLWIDRDYALWAAGLLAPVDPVAAWRLAWRSIGSPSILERDGMRSARVRHSPVGAGRR